MVSGYRQVVAHAAGRGVTVLLETHDVSRNSAHVAAMVEGVGDPKLRLVCDLMHPMCFRGKPAWTFGNIEHVTRHIQHTTASA